MNTQLYRTTDRIVSGVCGGLARYLRLDATLVRLFFVLLALGDGIGVLIYAILWLIMPSEDQPAGGNLNAQVHTNANEMADRVQEMAQEARRAVSAPNPQTYKIIGISLVVLGGMWLINTLDISWLHWLNYHTLWGILLIVGGVLLLTRRVQGE
ncbi:MAG TPA: PspC domain-containing protein [Anaerolineae bacterium]|nr:PspC domain-containing protein [Anaerolineae bacterium]